MKYGQIKAKLQRLFRQITKNKFRLAGKTLFDQILYPNLPTNFKTILPIYESEWTQMTPVLPNPFKLAETFDCTEEDSNGLPEEILHMECPGGLCNFPTYTGWNTFDGQWYISLLPDGGYVNNPKNLDFNFKIQSGGASFFERKYKCVNGDWQGFEWQLDEDGKCPVDGGEVVQAGQKFFTSYDGYADSSYANVRPAFAELQLYLENNLSIPLKTSYNLKIDDMNFAITADLGNDVIINEQCCQPWGCWTT